MRSLYRMKRYTDGWKSTVKKKIEINIKVDSGKKARRAARAIIGAPKPGQVIQERPLRKKPKYKKSLLAEEQ